MRLGFIGLGNLGSKLAASLRRAGFPLTVHDRDERCARRLLEGGATWAASPAAVGAASDSVITCLPSPAAVAEVLAGLLEGLRPGSTWIEMSTALPDELRRLAALAAAAGVGCLD